MLKGERAQITVTPRSVVEHYKSVRRNNLTPFPGQRRRETQSSRIWVINRFIFFRAINRVAQGYLGYPNRIETSICGGNHGNGRQAALRSLPFPKKFRCGKGINLCSMICWSSIRYWSGWMEWRPVDSAVRSGSCSFRRCRLQLKDEGQCNALWVERTENGFAIFISNCDEQSEATYWYKGHYYMGANRMYGGNVGTVDLNGGHVCQCLFCIWVPVVQLPSLTIGQVVIERIVFLLLLLN
jgi:hypothetical protein